MRQGTRTDLRQNCRKSIPQSEAAEMMGVSTRSVGAATKVMKTDPEAHDAAKRGEVGPRFDPALEAPRWTH